MDSAVPANPRENQRKWKEKKIGSFQWDETAVESDNDKSCIWHTWNGSQKFRKATRGIKNRRKNGDHTEHSIVKIDKKIQVSPEDLLSLRLWWKINI